MIVWRVGKSLGDRRFEHTYALFSEPINVFNTFFALYSSMGARTASYIVTNNQDIDRDISISIRAQLFQNKIALTYSNTDLLSLSFYDRALVFNASAVTRIVDDIMRADAELLLFRAATSPVHVANYIAIATEMRKRGSHAMRATYTHTHTHAHTDTHSNTACCNHVVQIMCLKRW